MRRRPVYNGFGLVSGFGVADDRAHGYAGFSVADSRAFADAGCSVAHDRTDGDAGNGGTGG
ncbi:MAG: hypothetical protein OXG46_09010 [Chloroflexi bacterium]|nr:hypothetical protein [Chloroflexota bacterium]MCY3939221.1 hypothetical protein [Chloroflexota bacterium]